ncbi:MAG: prephenate dehydratase, partial [Burkholderiales bacterium]
GTIMTSDIGDIRRRIDGIDEQIQHLIEDRARLAREVGASKKASAAVEFYRPEREAEVLRKVLARNRGPLKDEEMLRLFREIMSACLAQQEPLRVAFLGPEGTYTHAAVTRHFGHSVRTLPVPEVEEVFHEVENGNADFGVVPIENSTEGTVRHTLDMFLSSPLKICGEVELAIRHHLLGRMRSLGDVRRVCAHAQALAQCRTTLEDILPGIERIAVSSNAEGARRARDEIGTAAIASQDAAEIYGLEALVSEIEDRPDNTTRFHIIGRTLLAPSGRDKTTVLMSIADTESPGALYRLLEPLARHRVSMTRIESRPSRQRKWHYVFFVDLEGHAAEPAVAAALDELERTASLFKVLGAYPCGV